MRFSCSNSALVIPLSSIRNLESISAVVSMPAAKSSMISVSSSSAAEKRKLGKPRDGEPELDGEAVLRRSAQWVQGVH